jgi:hypothetical protein
LPAGKLSASRIAMVSRRHERAATRVVEELPLAKEKTIAEVWRAYSRATRYLNVA